MAVFKLLRQSPWSARIGMAMIRTEYHCSGTYICHRSVINFPYTQTEVVGDVWLEASREHLLGTDHLGRDLFTRLMWGARNTIFIALITTALAFVFGIICGFFAATLGGWTDQILSRAIDILMAFPTLIFALIMRCRWRAPP